MPIQQDDALKSSQRAILCDQTAGVRQRRRLVEERWLQTRRSWMGFNTGQFRPGDTDTADYNTPQGRRVIERSAVRIVKMLTPSVKWHEVLPVAEMPQERLSNIDMYMSYILRKKIRSRTNIAQLARCAILYNLPILKTSITVTNGQVWPTQRVVDPFSFYIFPETSTSCEDAQVIFEDALIPYERYQGMVKSGMVDPIDRSDIVKPDWPYHMVERLSYQGITDPTADVAEGVRDKVSKELERTTVGFVSMTELWTRRDGSLYQFYLAHNLQRGPRIVGAFKSLYDEPMYRLALHRSLPGETYTNSMGEDTTELDLIQNDLFNQFISAVNFEEGIMLLGDQAQQRRDNWKMKGRAIWDIEGMPREVAQFFEPPNTSNNKLKAYQVALGLLQALGGAGTMAEGQPGRNMPRAGFAVNNLLTLSLADLTDVAEILEQEILTHGLADIHRVSSLFIPEQQLIRIPGGQALLANGDKTSLLYKQDILGDVEFEWIGSLQSEDNAQRAQQLMIFLNMAPTLNPALQQMGSQINLPELIQMVWRYGLGERGLAKIVIPYQAPAMPLPVTGSEADPLAAQGAQGAHGEQQPMGGLTPSLPAVTNGYIQQ